MKYDPDKHHRRSIRLKEYDYRQAGAYFVTICTWQRESLLGEVINDAMELSRYGETVQFNWDILLKRYPNIELDAFIVMPNHIHGIILLNENDLERAGLERLSVSASKSSVKPAPTNYKIYGLSEIIRGFKTFSARRINQLRSQPGLSVWQRGYYEHVIRNQESLTAIREYIINNPLGWEKDGLYANNLSKWHESSPLVFESNGKSYIQGIVL
jgi:REP element-mobilizing transposase RayT